MGAAFLFFPAEEGKIFMREDLSPEQMAFGETCRDFFEKDVVPRSDEIETHTGNASVELFKKAGELGLLMAEVPEAYEGLGMDKRTATILAEEAVAQGSFSVTLMCHTGIGTLPILYFGTEEQKKKYLPKLASGEMMGAYALTEPGAGSDALAARTKAVLSDDGKHYILNGSKMFITNSTWADVMTVFAKVDGEKFTAFIVEKDYEGFSIGVEEHKMGIKGSSTTTVNLDDCKVPIENVLGEIGKGHKIAFNVLNIGRWKLGAGSAGGCKLVLNHMLPYLQDRKQFEKSLNEFGLIRKKISDVAMLSYVCESMMYCVAGLYDDAIAALDKNDPDYDRHCIEAIEKYAVEASVAKVFGSEALWQCADEGVQAFGGYGFSAEYPMEAIERNSRINRIFEGTNEINRMIIPGTILKRAMSGEFDMMSEIQKVLGELKEGYDVTAIGDWDSGTFKDRVNVAKRLAIYACGVAVQKYMADIKDQQYALESMANIVIGVFAMDCAYKRTQQLLEKDANQKVSTDLASIYIAETYNKILITARELIGEIADGDENLLGKYQKALTRFDLFAPINATKLREQVATHMVERGKYSLT
ncbi:acyl-CoA dehydrogenase family protein [bacterium]|nr:acyl-CoA dehydrogenase family protein [bacterium]